MLAILRAIDDNTVNILNVSYGACELSQGAAGNQAILNAWEQAAAQGIAVTVSSGDSGSAGCDNPDTQMVASRGFGVKRNWHRRRTPWRWAARTSTFC